MWSAVVGLEDCALSVKIRDNCQAVVLQFLLPVTVKNTCINLIAFYGCVSYCCPWSASILSASRPSSLLLTRGSRECARFVPYSSHIFPFVCFISVFFDVEAAGAAEDLGSCAPCSGSWRRARWLRRRVQRRQSQQDAGGGSAGSEEAPAEESSGEPAAEPTDDSRGGSGWFSGSDSGEDSKSGANSESESQKKSESTPEPQKEFYANCDDAKAAGAAPMYKGDPGYRPELDRDKDGIACDKKGYGLTIAAESRCRLSLLRISSPRVLSCRLLCA